MTAIKDKNRRGFTLIEILVVVAIIGILSTIIIVFLGNARNLAKDSHVIANARQIKNLIELGRTNDWYTDIYAATFYLPGIMIGNASNSNVVCSGSGPSYPAISRLLTDAINQGGSITIVVYGNADGKYCFDGTNTWSHATSYAIYGKLITDPTKYFCTDSAGSATQKATAATTNTCP